MYRSKEASAYMHRLRVLVLMELRKLLPKTGTLPVFPQEEVAITVLWYRGRRAGDLDKRLGVVLDALQEIVYANDAQVVQLSAHRYESEREEGYVDLQVYLK